MQDLIVNCSILKYNCHSQTLVLACQLRSKNWNMCIRTQVAKLLHHLGSIITWVSTTKFRTMKIDIDNLIKHSTKNSTHENNPLYCTLILVHILLRELHWWGKPSWVSLRRTSRKWSPLRPCKEDTQATSGKLFHRAGLNCGWNSSFTQGSLPSTSLPSKPSGEQDCSSSACSASTSQISSLSTTGSSVSKSSRSCGFEIPEHWHPEVEECIRNQSLEESARCQIFRALVSLLFSRFAKPTSRAVWVSC